MLSLEPVEGWRVMQESAKALRQIPCHDLMTFLVSRATLAVEPSLNLVASDTICAIFVFLDTNFAVLLLLIHKPWLLVSIDTHSGSFCSIRYIPRSFLSQTRSIYFFG